VLNDNNKVVILLKENVVKTLNVLMLRVNAVSTVYLIVGTVNYSVLL